MGWLDLTSSIPGIIVVGSVIVLVVNLLYPWVASWYNSANGGTKTTCLWIDVDGTYKTSCGYGFAFYEDGPKDNGFSHCPYCGRKINQQ